MNLPPDLPLRLSLIGLCLVAQGFFSGSEIAIVSSDRLVLQAQAESGNARAGLVLRMLEKPAYIVGTMLVGTSVAVVAGSTLVADLLVDIGDVPEILVAAVYAPLTILFSELLPKSVFQRYSNTLAPLVAQPIAALSVVLRPFLWLLEQGTRIVFRLFGMSDVHVHTVRREEIQVLLNSAAQTDIQAEEKAIIGRVLQFSEKVVADAMVPLIEVVGVSETATVDEAAAMLVESGFSRLPVYRKRIDRIVGVVIHHDLVFATDGAAPVSSVMRPVLFVPETKSVDDLFLELRRRRNRVAVAVDEYGGAVGIISIEDILEEIVGEIDDESSRRAPLVRKVGEREWIASGRVEGEILRAFTGFEMPEGDYETLAGFLLDQFGQVPPPGEKLTWGGFVFTVVKSSDRAILEVSVQRADLQRKQGVGG